MTITIRENLIESILSDFSLILGKKSVKSSARKINDIIAGIFSGELTYQELLKKMPQRAWTINDFSIIDSQFKDVVGNNAAYFELIKQETASVDDKSVSKLLKLMLKDRIYLQLNSVIDSRKKIDVGLLQVTDPIEVRVLLELKHSLEQLEEELGEMYDFITTKRNLLTDEFELILVNRSKTQLMMILRIIDILISAAENGVDDEMLINKVNHLNFERKTLST